MKYLPRLILLPAFLLSTALAAQHDPDDYIDIRADLASGRPLAEVAERAHDQAADYYERADGEHAGAEDKDLSAYEAVREIFQHAEELGDEADAEARDVIEVVVSVVDAWTECSDTFEAVKRGVELAPDRAAEIAATIAIKKDCNCAAGGIWPTERVEGRIRVEYQPPYLDVPRACSCSQAAMYGAVAGLPENEEYQAADPADEERLDRISRMMVEKTNEIIERTSATQSGTGWDCSCTDVNLAGAMRGIESDELRERTWEGLGHKYVEEAGDGGLVVDVFGTVGMHPAGAWGSDSLNSAANTLRRKPRVYRGDPLLLDPFDPALEWEAYPEDDTSNLRAHQQQSEFRPTDVFLTEYVEAWSQEALNRPEGERERTQRNRALEIYNGTDRTIDLGADQYVLEIYGPSAEPVSVAAPPANLVRNTLSLDSGVTFELDQSDIRPQAEETLDSIAAVLDEADIVSELLIVGHTCDLASDEYNQALSERRARSVRDYLLAQGLDVEAVRIEGRGESEPAVPNTSEAERKKNRRVEITFVTPEGMEIERTATGTGADRVVQFAWVTLGEAAEPAEREPMAMAYGDARFVEGEESPREVIGLNGSIEPGETLVVAYDNSDEAILDQAQIVTGQLDFDPSDTLVIRRFGGDLGLTCHAHALAVLINYPPDRPILIKNIRPVQGPQCIDPRRCDNIDIASPN